MDAHLLEPLGELLQRQFQTGDPESAGKLREQAHVRSLARLFGAIVAGDFDAYAASLCEDVQVELLVPPEFPFIRRANGRDEARALAVHNFGTLTEQVPEIVSVTAQGDTVVLEGRETGRIRSSGRWYEILFVYHMTLRDGQVARARLYSAYGHWSSLPAA